MKIPEGYPKKYVEIEGKRYPILVGKEIPEGERKLLKSYIELIRRGRYVRPPSYWFYSARKLIMSKYKKPEDLNEPYRTQAKRCIKRGGRNCMDKAWSRITAGIWLRYPPNAKIRIIRKILSGEDGIMEPRGKEWELGSPAR